MSIRQFFAMLFGASVLGLFAVTMTAIARDQHTKLVASEKEVVGLTNDFLKLRSDFNQLWIDREDEVEALTTPTVREALRLWSTWPEVCRAVLMSVPDDNNCTGVLSTWEHGMPQNTRLAIMGRPKEMTRLIREVIPVSCSVIGADNPKPDICAELAEQH